MLGNTKVLVTGGAGFIGSHLVDRLIAMNCRVTVIDNFAVGSLDNLEQCHLKYELIVGDLGDLVEWKTFKLNDYDYVFHLASTAYVPDSVANPRLDFHANLKNSFTLLEELRSLNSQCKLIYPSTGAVYGNPVSFPIKEDDLTVPVAPYGVAKLAVERYIHVYSKLFGIKAASLRLFSVYGPRQRKQVVYDLLTKLTANPNKVNVFGDGSQTRDFVYVQDVVDAFIIVAECNSNSGEVYNVASGHAVSIKDLLGAWSEVLGINPEIVYQGSVRPGDAEHWSVDISKLKRLGFSPSTDIKANLNNIYEWFNAKPQSNAGTHKECAPTKAS